LTEDSNRDYSITCWEYVAFLFRVAGCVEEYNDIGGWKLDDVSLVQPIVNLWNQIQAEYDLVKATGLLQTGLADLLFGKTLQRPMKSRRERHSDLIHLEYDSDDEDADNDIPDEEFVFKKDIQPEFFAKDFKLLALIALCTSKSGFLTPDVMTAKSV
jgi:hypothetical protein